MKYSGTSFTLFLVDAYNLIASLSESANLGKESITQQTNPFGVDSEEHTPIGMTKGTLEVGGGFFDPATDALHHVVGATRDVQRVVSAGFEGNTIGAHFVGFQGSYDHTFTVMDKRDGLTMADVKYLVSGDVDEGVIVQNLATFTADWDTKTGGAGVTDAPVDYALDPSQRPINITSATKASSSVVTTSKAHGLVTGQVVVISGNTLAGPAINGAQTVTVVSPTSFSVSVNTTASTGAGTGGSFVLGSTVGGGVGYLHCTAYSGFTGFVNTIMHSPDDVTYASLLAFTNLTAVGKERKTVTGTVDRYLSNNGNVTGTGSVTVFAGFCRN